jgi:glutamyl/glutaminyl-tRNA synthetase
VRTRIAPTPSGFLHRGNLLNFVLIQKLATSHNWQNRLRIDDFDELRSRANYVEDIFEKIQQLSIQIHSGPNSSEELSTTHSQTLRKNLYWETLSKMREASDLIFVCCCSRNQLVKDECVQNCQANSLEYSPGANAIRIRLQNSDEVLWRREDLPAYHLVDVIEDDQNQISHVVRGVDLYESTQTQSAIRNILNVAAPIYLFHPLVRDSAGLKLSKSQGTNRLTVDADLIHWLSNQAEIFLPGLERQLISPIGLGLDQALPTDDLLC